MHIFERHGIRVVFALTSLMFRTYAVFHHFQISSCISTLQACDVFLALTVVESFCRAVLCCSHHVFSLLKTESSSTSRHVQFAVYF